MTDKKELNVFSVIQAGLVLGTTLAWADVIKTGTKYFYPYNEDKVFQAQIVYAMIITIFLIIGFYLLKKAADHTDIIKTKLDKKFSSIKNNSKQIELKKLLSTF